MCGLVLKVITLRNSECFQQACALHTKAWNNVKVLVAFVGFVIGARVDRDGWGHLYLTVRGEILGFVKDRLLRKHLPWMFSLIKNES